MKANFRVLVLCVIIPVAVGALSALLTMNSMQSFDMIIKPPLSPPGWLFPVVWSILFILMGIASYLVYTSDAPKEQISKALAVYSVQLVVNFFWSLIFFNLEAYLFAFFWLVLLWILIIVTLVQFWNIRRSAGLLLLPYLAWVTFAGYLNYAIYLLN